MVVGLQEQGFAMGRQAKPDGSTRVVRSHQHEYIWEKSNGVWVLQHRLVMSRKLGRPLSTREHVHHINEDTLDNRPENLTLVTPHAHTRHHAPERKPKRPKSRCARKGCDALIPASTGKKYCSPRCRWLATHVTRTCPWCGTPFVSYRCKGQRFCSRSCARKYERSERGVDG